ncbi:hypothetical protein [Roseobacter sp. AzwK-3b]|uniref:hypothetical protein n=1 Tax=Roseobacter sp. AzwK-3b TaxID=351016 RepID=UPI0012F51BC8|nr:hypothetical protein [Roseobacter sp. AzwK-3b]
MVYILFQRLPLREALVWSIVAGYLLLPLRTGFDLPALPPVDKNLIPALMAALMCYLVTRQAKTAHAVAQRAGSEGVARKMTVAPPISFEPVRGQWLFRGLVILLFVPPFITALTNAEPIIQGARFISGLSLYDALSMNSEILFSLIPFFLARRFLASDEAHRVLLKVIVIAALGYSLLALYEVRMSPQLNRTFYGFFPHSFIQHMRGDGFRPLVFLNHGLWLAIFFALSVVSAFALFKATKTRNKPLWFMAGLWLFMVLFLMKSLGAFALTLLVVPGVLFLSRKTQLLMVACLALFVLLFPFARTSGLVPLTPIQNLAESINPARAQSLNYRLNNEDILLAKASQKPLFGWGGWGRGRVYNESGQDISTTDGYWIIIKGTYGWFGYLGRFGLLCLPLIIIGFMLRRLEFSYATTGLAMAMSVGIVDLIPNGTISPVLWLVAGAIMGRYQTVRGAVTAKIAADRKPQNRAQGALGPETLPTDTGYARPLHTRQPRRS